MANIDTLSIQITASTKTAKDKIDALTKSLGALSKAIDSLDTSKFETLAAATGDLSQGLQGLKGSGVKQIEKVGKAINSVNEAASKDTLENVANDVKKVSDKSKAASENIESVNTSLSGFDGSSINEVSSAMDKVTTTVKKTATEMGAFKSLLASTKIIIPTEGLEKVDKKIESLEEKIADLKDKLNWKSETKAGYVDSEEMEKDQEKIEGLINELDRLKLKKQELESHGGFKLNLGATIDNLRKGFEAVNKKLDGFIAKIRKAKTHTKDTSKATKDFSLASSNLAKELTRVTKMLKLMVTRMILRKVIQNAIDGFKNLIQYSSEVNASVSLLWNSFRQLGNSVAAAASPLLNALAPVLEYLIQLCIKLVNAINQVISALMGKTTWTKAKKLSDDYGASLDKSNKSAKDLKRTILGFDEINQLQDNKDSGGAGGTSPADMFEDAKIEAKWKDLARKLKAILKQLLAPIKKAWANVGDEVVAAWTGAFKSVKKLLEDIGRDFLKVWNQPQTVKMLENILRIFRDIGSVIRLLADGLDKAWNKNKTGLKILEGIRDIFAIIIQHVKNMTSATVLWAKELNFTPILTAFKDWVESMKPVVDAIAGSFEDFYNKVLLPLGKWSLEKGLPDLIDVFKRFNDEVEWDTIRERLNRVWEALEPFAEKVGEGLTIFIGKVADKIASFLNSKGWDDFIDTLVKWTEKVDADDVARGLEKIFTALAAYKTVDTLVTIVNKVNELKKVAGTGIKIGITFTIAFEIASKILDWIFDFFQWIEKISMEKAGYDKVSIDVEMKWWDKFQENYGGITGKGLFFKDFIFGNTDKKVKEFYVQAKAETFGITDAEVEVEDLRKATENLKNSDGIQMFVEKADGSIQKLKNVSEGAAEPLKKSTAEAQKSFGDLAVSVEKDTTSIKKSADNIKLTPVAKEASDLKTNMSKSFGDLKITVEKDTSSINKSANSINFQPLTDAAKNMDTNVTIDFENVDTAVANTNTFMSGQVHEMSASVDGATKDIQKSTDTIKESFDKDKWTFSGVGEGLKKTFEDARDKIKSVWNQIAEKLNGKHQIGGASMNINLPIFARGGFPEDGLFMANHNELVGEFSNGKTAVANNGQIVEGIRQGVYEAVSMAMSQSQGGGNVPVQTSIYIGEEQVARAVTRGQRKLDRRYSPTMA